MKKILVVGDLILDIYIHGNVKRISPEAPVPIFNEFSKEYKMGGAANVALNIKKLNGDVSLLGLVGNDKEGSQLKHLLKSNRIKLDILSLREISTINKSRLVVNNHQLMRIDREDIKKNTDFSDIILKKFKKIFN